MSSSILVRLTDGSSSVLHGISFNSFTDFYNQALSTFQLAPGSDSYRVYARDQQVTEQNFTSEALYFGPLTFVEPKYSLFNHTKLTTPIKIYVMSHSSEGFRLEVTPLDTLSNLKAQLDAKTGKQAADWKFFYKGSSVDVLQKSLLSLGVKQLAIIYAVVQDQSMNQEEINVDFLYPEGMKRFRAAITHDTLVEKLQQRIASATGLELQNVVLLYLGRQLTGNKTAAESLLIEGSQVLVINKNAAPYEREEWYRQTPKSVSDLPNFKDDVQDLLQEKGVVSQFTQQDNLLSYSPEKSQQGMNEDQVAQIGSASEGLQKAQLVQEQSLLTKADHTADTPSVSVLYAPDIQQYTQPAEHQDVAIEKTTQLNTNQPNNQTLVQAQKIEVPDTAQDVQKFEEQLIKEEQQVKDIKTEQVNNLDIEPQQQSEKQISLMDYVPAEGAEQESTPIRGVSELQSPLLPLVKQEQPVNKYVESISISQALIAEKEETPTNTPTNKPKTEMSVLSQESIGENLDRALQSRQNIVRSLVECRKSESFRFFIYTVREVEDEPALSAQQAVRSDSTKESCIAKIQKMIEELPPSELCSVYINKTFFDMDKEPASHKWQRKKEHTIDLIYRILPSQKLISAEEDLLENPIVERAIEILQYLPMNPFVVVFQKPTGQRVVQLIQPNQKPLNKISKLLGMLTFPYENVQFYVDSSLISSEDKNDTIKWKPQELHSICVAFDSEFKQTASWRLVMRITTAIIQRPNQPFTLTFVRANGTRNTEAYKPSDKPGTVQTKLFKLLNFEFTSYRFVMDGVTIALKENIQKFQFKKKTHTMLISFMEK